MAEDKQIGLEAIAEIRQVKTMADYSVNVVLNLPEPFKPAAKMFMDWQGKMIRIVAVLETD
jgi:hypothetical protein